MYSGLMSPFSINSCLSVYLCNSWQLLWTRSSGLPCFHTVTSPLFCSFFQIFGFLNLILWAGNCWFIYKETSFHKDPNQQPATVEEGGVSGP